MKSLRSLFLLSLLGFALSTSAAPTMGWIAPYNIEIGKSNFEAYGTTGLTYIAMQFWVPNGANVNYASSYDAPEGYSWDAIVEEIRDTAHAYGVKAMLCVYNGESGFNWSIASNALSNSNRDGFIASLVAEMQRLNLDGIEVDLEGVNADNSTDRNNLITFISDLGAILRPLGKHLTIATFASAEWDHIPDASHWPDLLPHVDALTSMGYQEIGITAPGDLSYAGQKSLAGAYAHKLMLGLPDNYNSWQGTTPSTAVSWAQANGTGVAVWEMRLGEGWSGPKSAWQNSSLWNAMGALRGPLIKQFEVEVTRGVGGTVSPEGTVRVDSAESKTFTITPDEWFVVDEVKLDNNTVGAGTSYTLDAIAANHSLHVTFKKDPAAPTLYTLTATASANGTISPLGGTTAAEGSSKTFTITPDASYQVSGVVINGEDRGPIVSATFSGITANHTLEASFKEATGGDLGKYPQWTSSIAIPNGDICYYNDSLWLYQGSPTAGGWGASMTPSISLADIYGTPPWKFSGLYNGMADTLIVADLDYRSGVETDTLILTTDTAVSGVATGSGVDTILVTSETEPPTALEIPRSVQGETRGLQLKMMGSSLQFTPTAAGVHHLALYSLQGRQLFATTLSATVGQVMQIALRSQGLSRGVYLMEVRAPSGQTLVQKFQMP